MSVGKIINVLLKWLKKIKKLMVGVAKLNNLHEFEFTPKLWNQVTKKSQKEVFLPIILKKFLKIDINARL